VALTYYGGLGASLVEGLLGFLIKDRDSEVFLKKFRRLVWDMT